MKNHGAIRRRIIGILAGLIVGAVAVVSAPSASAADYPTISPPEGVWIYQDIAPGNEAYVKLRSEFWESSCYDGTCRYEHFFQLPDGATFVDAPIYYYNERNGQTVWRTISSPTLSDGNRSLQATWATSMVIRGPEQILAKVRIDADVPDGALAVVDLTVICTPAYQPGETCAPGLERSAGVIVVSPLGIPVADATVVVPTLLVLGGVVLVAVLMRRRPSAQAV